MLRPINKLIFLYLILFFLFFIILYRLRTDAKNEITKNIIRFLDEYIGIHFYWILFAHLKDLKLGILGFTLVTIFIGLRQFKKLKEYDRIYTKILAILYLNFIVFGNVLMFVFFEIS